jgi:hypothetical protein
MPLRARTYNLVRTRFPEIRLQPFGVLVTDGYRPAVGRASLQPFLEENVTALMQIAIKRSNIFALVYDLGFFPVPCVSVHDSCGSA